MVKKYKYINVRKTGYQICRLLDDKNISVYEVATQLEVSQTAVYKWLRGTSLPNLAHLFQISQMLEVSLEDILVTS